MSDLKDLLSLANLVNLTNLPADYINLEKLLKLSCDSFDGFLKKSEKDLENRIYLFVLEDLSKNKIIGTSQIIAAHGTKDMPHAYFQVQKITHRSQALKESHTHKILKLGFDREGYTELAGLIIDPSYRHVPQKLGRALSLIRFEFIRNNLNLFKDRLIAELLPPYLANGESALWRDLGGKFMSLSFEEADNLSRDQKEYIETLLPKDPIYITLLSKESQSSIGKVGENTKPAEHLLRSLGFKYQNRVDPFDGGPHFEMLSRDLPAINSSWGCVKVLIN